VRQLEHEVLSRHHFATKTQARSVVIPWCEEFYNQTRRHSSAARMSPHRLRERCQHPTGSGIRKSPRFEGKPRLTFTRGAAFVINVAAVIYLLFAKRLFGLRGGRRAYDAERRGEQLLEVERSALSSQGVAGA